MSHEKETETKKKHLTKSNWKLRLNTHIVKIKINLKKLL